TKLPAEVALGDAGLWPLGNEIHLFQGIRMGHLGLPDEELQLGVFRIGRPRIEDGGGELTLTLEGYDRARTVSKARFTKPYVIPEGTDVATAIKDLIHSRIPWLTDSDFIF